MVGTAKDVDCPVPYVRVIDSRYAMAHLAAAFYDFPARQMTMIGVTGTDGKTTTSNIIFQNSETGRHPGGHDLHGECSDWRRGVGYRLPRYHTGFPGSAGIPGAHASLPG